MKIGIDFGSTYSTFASYDAAADEVKALSLTEGAAVSVPSVVSIGNKNGKVFCGQAAKDLIGKKIYRSFEAFKMLLVEEDQNLLRGQGYDETYTPKEIAKLYLQKNLDGILRRFGDEDEERIENVVICIPEIWGSGMKTQDGRNILLHILKNELEIPIEHVQAVTEPEAASAFFAYNYTKETQKPFNGHLLLIDYGGGTLDITLTEIATLGSGSMEITYREGGGAGENHPAENGVFSIGNAGIAFMRGVVVEALVEQGFVASEEEIDCTSPSFREAVRDLENQMKSSEGQNGLEDAFGIYKRYKDFTQIYEEEDLDEFTILQYEDEELPVSYQNLFSAYQKKIEKVLAEQVREINRKVADHIQGDPCEIHSGMNDDFKIAIVGGFGSCYFVKAQLAEIYHFDSNVKNDPRVKNIAGDKREQAIALGAGLLAAGKVCLKKISRCSIGIYSHETSGKYTFHYGIQYHQTIEPGKPYYICHSDTAADTAHNRIPYGALQNNITELVIEFSERKDHGGLMPLRPEMLMRLAKLPKEGIWNLGFSLNENDVICVHIVPDTRFHAEGELAPLVIPLEDYKNMFDLSMVREVTI